jgi:hypothetical protein
MHPVVERDGQRMQSGALNHEAREDHEGNNTAQFRNNRLFFVLFVVRVVPVSIELRSAWGRDMLFS